MIVPYLQLAVIYFTKKIMGYNLNNIRDGKGHEIIIKSIKRVAEKRETYLTTSLFSGSLKYSISCQTFGLALGCRDTSLGCYSNCIPRWQKPYRIFRQAVYIRFERPLEGVPKFWWITYLCTNVLFPKRDAIL